MGREPVQPAEQGHAEAPSIALVGEGGVRKPIAQHYRPIPKRRLYALRHVLAAASQNEESFGGGRHRFCTSILGVGVEENITNALRPSRPTWFPCFDNPMAVLTESLGQPSQLGRFATSLDPLEGDQDAPPPPPVDPHVLTFNRAKKFRS